MYKHESDLTFRRLVDSGTPKIFGGLAVRQSEGASVAREPRKMEIQLGALLDERDHIRIKISLMEEHDEDGEVFALRQRLIALDKEIMSRWAEPPAQPGPAD